MLGVCTMSRSSSPTPTMCSTSAIVTLAAVAIIGLKFRAVFRYTRFPHGSPFHARINAKSAFKPNSIKQTRPSNSRTSFPSPTKVPTPVGVKNAGIPAPPARIRSENVPCGTRSNCTRPFRTISSSNLFSPTYVPTCREICPFASSNPMPNPSTPTLLLIVVRFFTPFLTRARIKFSGIPHKPKPPNIMEAPSWTSRIASSALATILFIDSSSTYAPPQTPFPTPARPDSPGYAPASVPFAKVHDSNASCSSKQYPATSSTDSPRSLSSPSTPARQPPKAATPRQTLPPAPPPSQSKSSAANAKSTRRAGHAVAPPSTPPSLPSSQSTAPTRRICQLRCSVPETESRTTPRPQTAARPPPQSRKFPCQPSDAPPETAFPHSSQTPRPPPSLPQPSCCPRRSLTSMPPPPVPVPAPNPRSLPPAPREPRRLPL